MLVWPPEPRDRAMVEAMKRATRNLSGKWAKKSGKREMAAGLLVLWCVMTVYLVWLAPESRVPIVLAVYTTATAFIGPFAAFAFGLDSLQKGGMPTRAPETKA